MFPKVLTFLFLLIRAVNEMYFYVNKFVCVINCDPIDILSKSKSDCRVNLINVMRC